MFSYFNGYILFPLMEKYAKRDVLSKLRALKQFETLSAREKLNIQASTCVRFLEHCGANVPYYRDLFLKHNFAVENVRKDLKYIQDLPILTKDIVRHNHERMRSSQARHIRKTGGSTGQSVHFYYDDEGLDWTSAINLLSYEMAGKRPHHSDCHISGDLEILGLQAQGLKTRWMDSLRLFVQNRERLMLSSFSDDQLADAVTRLAKISPYLLQGHPSSAFAIANFIERTGTKPPKIAVFEPSGEMLTEKLVQKIESVLRCRVVNRYGNAECGVIAHSRPLDPYNRLLIFDRAFFVEECEENPLVVTSFTNYGFPLIRYDTGDVGTVKKEAEGTFLYDIQGRVHDIVSIDSREYPTHFLMDVLDHKVGNIREFQIVLESDRLPLLNIVVEFENDKSRIESKIREVWPRGLDIRFINYEELKTVGWRQKFRHIVDLRKAK